MNLRAPSPDGVLQVDVEVGMSLTGRNNLAESPLLKLIGDIRWHHIAHFAGVPSKQLADETGQRLYATFFYVDVHFSEEKPMASFGENDRFTIVNTLSSHDNSMLDGYHFIFPAEWPDEKKRPPRDGQEALKAVPYIRSSNAFVKMVQGASWLKTARPVQSGLDGIARLKSFPDTFPLILGVTDKGGFGSPPEHFSSLTRGKIKVEYRPDPDRDLNGAGLLYFANYPMVIDYAERRVLTGNAQVPFSSDLVDDRTLVRRQTAYLCNIHQSDSIEVHLEAWIENPFLGRNPHPPANPIRLFINSEMYRRSDGRKMMVCTAEKIVYGRTLEDAGLIGPLEGMARAARVSRG